MLKARLEAEEARLKAEKELERLKAVAEERAMLMEAAKVTELLRAEEEAQSDRMSANARDSSMSIVEVPDRPMPSAIIEESEESKSTTEERSMPLNKYSEEIPVAKNAVIIEKSMSMDADTKEELMSMIAEMEERATSQINDSSIPNKTGDKNQICEEDGDSVDIVEKMRAVWASDDDESPHVDYGSSYDESEYENQDDHVAQSTNLVDDGNENESDHSDDHSYLPGSLQSSPERKSKTISKDLHDFPSLTMPQIPLNLASLEDTVKFQRSALLKNDRDFPSMTMPHRQVSAAQILDTAEPSSLDAKVTPSLQNDLPRRPSIIDDEEGEANIFHVARVTFDGDPSKGQLSFTTGSEVLAHSNQRGDWWLGRCGGRTGWFPAAAVVPASEFLRGSVDTAYNPVQNAEDDDDIDLEFPKLSEEELNSVYDFIRSPSGDDDSPKRVRKESPRPDSRTLDPSQCVGLEQRHESTENDDSDVKHAFDSMMNVYDSMVTPASARDSDQRIKEKEEPSLTVSEETSQTEANYNIQIVPNDTNQTETNQERPAHTAQAKKPKRLWRSALDPNTGLTYYYNVKTRETTWDKPPGFVEKKSPAKSPTSIESKPIEQDSGQKETTAKDSSKSGSKRFLGLFSKPSTKKTHSSPSNVSDRKAINPTVPQNTKTTNEREVEAKTHITNHVASSPCDYSEDDDVSSVSSEETSTSIFSTKRMREAIVKVTSKIAGKITTIPTNNSYDVLDDSNSPQVDGKKNAQTVEKELPAINGNEETKEEIQPYEDRDESNRQVKPNPDGETTTSASGTTSVQPASHGTKKDSRWRAAIDPLTGRTYYFHKDTQETVWEKPKNL
ncbi:hypothetical protein HJC23_005758 [Cyclotella cryptica]|uniref:Uncharacterized protein n=1 Tax=Cyclotella cryptica TaxID=29204 RepID=A0ABD3QDN8_9STRA